MEDPNDSSSSSESQENQNIVNGQLKNGISQLMKKKIFGIKN